MEEEFKKEIGVPVKAIEIAVVIVALVLGGLYYVYYQVTLESRPGISEEDLKINNEQALGSALNDRNLQACDSIKGDTTLKRSCKKDVGEYMISDQAIGEKNSSNCESITDPDLRSYCLTVSSPLENNDAQIEEMRRLFNPNI